MKKFTTFLLTAGLLLQNTVPLQASIQSSVPAVHAVKKAVAEQPSGEVSTEWLDAFVQSRAAGAVSITLANVLPMYRDVNVTATATATNNDSGKVNKVQTTLQAGTDSTDLFIGGLADGSYTLRLQVAGFEDYVQELEVKGNILYLYVGTGMVSLDGINYEQGDTHPGLFLVGDVDGDGEITQSDKDAILDAASGKQVQGLTDLNGDGRTDILDLQYYAFAQHVKNDGIDTTASVTESIAPDAAAVKVNDENTIVTGDIADLLTGNGGLTFSTANEEPVSEDNPVEIGISFQNEDMAQAETGLTMEQVVIETGDVGIESGTLIVETEDGVKYFQIGTAAVAVAAYSARSAEGSSIVIGLGGQVAVKKVIIRVTAAAKGASLVDISKVEFLNGMENRIPEPEMDIPQNVKAQGADKSFTLTWDNSKNVTGYEVEITHDGETETVRTAGNTLKVSTFAGKELVNKEIYSVRVQAVNGAWRSGFTSAVEAVPKLAGRPDAPDYLKATGAYRKLKLTWKDMDDTDSYCVYYRVKGDAEYTKISGIEGSTYEITGLADKTVYEVYVTGVNELGESAASLVSEAETTMVIPAQLPKYNMINEPQGEGELTAHIVSATHPRGSMVNSPLDEEGTDSALGIVDNNYNSYYYVADWDEGGAYPADNKGIYFTFDAKYKMNYIAFAEPEDTASYAGASLYWYEDDHKTNHAATIAGVLQKTDANGRKYYVIKLSKPIESDMIRVGFTRYGAYRSITISEVRFYYYDSLEDDVLALYADDLHTTLKDGTTAETIAALQKRLDTVDEKSGEYNPERESIQKELDNAKGLLDTKLGDVIEISSEITATKDGHLGISGLNAWQPLGVSAASGEQVTIYVGHNTKKTGDTAQLKLIATQYHAESGTVKTEVATLKVGRNEVTIPKLQSLSAESGGALYVAYTGNNENDRYAVRVSGGVNIPVLNLYGVTNDTEREEKIYSYVEALEEHVANIEEIHDTVHEAAGNDTGAAREFDEQNCIAGATDIMLDKMMYSVSAKMLLAGLGNGTTKERADKLSVSLTAMDEMMELFYQHKGLTNEEGAGASDRMPSEHLNIRYMRMFAGAFMYAAGDHIGIDWNSVSGLSSAVPITSDDGKYKGGLLFGWGIAHEIGHNINQSAYSIAEITNNYFAQLTTARDTNESVRWKYADVYEKVTSGTKGASPDLAVQLAMYWQLHLAYDRGYNFKTYDTHEEQMKNLFYARVDSYARNVDNAPAPKGVTLTLGTDKNQNFMRLACAAAGKDLTEYFVRWGMEPDEGTLEYAGQFPAEERAIYYITDEARVYEIENGTDNTIKNSAVISDTSSVKIGKNAANEVVLTINSSVDADILLGYEITRIMYENGQEVREVAGFAVPDAGASAAEWKDYVSTVNNRVVAYEVTAVDKFGYRPKAENIGSVRIEHDGSLDKSMWTVTTNMKSGADTTVDATEKNPCEPEEKPAVLGVIDNDYDSTYTGAANGADAYITISLNRTSAVSALKYTSPDADGITAYRIEVSEDGADWKTVAEGTFKEGTTSNTVYFENENKDPWVATYDVAYVRITAVGSAGQKVAINELDLLGPSGDSISFGADGTSVGILANDYEYETGKYIPQGSLVFMGSYKGNPAYNVVLLYDEDGNIVGGADEDGSVNAQHIILATVPENGLLGEVSDGTWIYWIEPDAKGNVPEFSGAVRAELYRVDNAMTNAGQRIVSDTPWLTIPDKLGSIELTD